MREDLKIYLESIGKYVEDFLRTIFEQPINIAIVEKNFVLNGEKRFPIYELFSKSPDELLKDFNNNSFMGDYITTIFFFLSGYWEYIHPNIRDALGRFPGKKSFQYFKGILGKPVVDILVDEIGIDLGLSYKSQNPKIFLTHDVDNLSRFSSLIRNGLGDIIKRRSFGTGFGKILGIRNKRKLEYLLRVHEKYGTKGTFFFLPGIQPKEFGGGYDVEKSKSYLRKVSNQIIDAGSCVGIHYDVRHIEKENMIDDINILSNIFEIEIFSGRAHYLLFDIRRSFDIYENSYIKLDTTGGYADIIGFRFGTSHPFKPFNFATKRAYNLLEVPLIVMDVTMFSKNYMGLDAEQSFERIRVLMDEVKNYKGIFTFLWHNTSFDNIVFNADWIYYKSIEYALEEGFSSVNACEIVREFLY